MSSLFSALTVAVSGLTAQSDAIGSISDDLSNAQTTGFKAIGTEFESLVTQSNASVNNPGGVRATPLYQNDVQGNLVQSGTATSLAISGQGFFPVETATTDATGATTLTGNTLFTRQGDFTLNQDGYLVNGSGYYLLGYGLSQTTGTIDTSQTEAVQISALLNNPVATTQVTYEANLPSNVTTPFTSAPSTIQVFDALGNEHELDLTWTKSATTPNAWTLNATVAGGASSASSAGNYTASIPFTFNSTSNTGTIESIASSSGSNYTVSTNASGQPASVTFDGLTFPGTGSQNITLDVGSYDTATGVTQFANSSDQVSVNSFEQNGLPEGSFSSIGIDSSGNVSINYNNGSSKVVAQIPIVQFFAQDQLQRVTGGAYEATLASGSARYSAPGASGAGTIVGGSLESSNVDIATEFTDMIQAQQVYSANAKTITTIDNMLNTIINTVQ